MSRTTLIVNSLLSSVGYGFWGAIALVLVKSYVSPALMGAFAETFAFALLFALIILMKRTSKLCFSVYGALAGVCYFVGNLFFYKALSVSTLTAVYAFVPLATLFAFFLIKRSFSGLKLPKLVLPGIILAVIGTMLCEGLLGATHSVNLFVITAGIIMIIVYGLAEFLAMYALTKRNDNDINFVGTTFAVEIVAFIAIYPFIPQVHALSTSVLYLLVLLGIAVGTGYILELHEMQVSVSKKTKREFIDINIVNVLSGSSIIIVLATAVFLKSYTLGGILGLLLITIGTIMLYWSH